MEDLKTWTEDDLPACCRCGAPDNLVAASGQGPTGVVAPDGYGETVYEDEMVCKECMAELRCK